MLSSKHFPNAKQFSEVQAELDQFLIENDIEVISLKRNLYQKACRRKAFYPP